MTEEELVTTYPRLWHMAHDGSWPAIEAHGLMSTAALVEAYGITGQDAQLLTRVRRPESVPIEREGLPGAVVRDQKPIHEPRLAKCLLDGLKPEDWYRILNSHSFFWLSRERVNRLLNARAYRNLRQTVLTLDTRTLVAAHRDRIRLSPINSGATLFAPMPRGPGTFKSIADFPFAERAKTRPVANNVVELLVEHSVPDVRDHVLAVHELQGAQILNEIWRSPRGTADDHP